MLIPSKITETEVNNPDGTTTVKQTVAFEDLISTDFVANKHTYHPTGLTHTTNKNDERHISGIKSLPFDKIEKIQQIAIIIPQNPIKYPPVLKEHLRQDDVILETEWFRESPFQIDIYILRQNN